METNVNYALVGAFVITLITSIVLGIIWLSSGFSSGTYSTYEIYMKESVAGLSIDSVVEFNGVIIGNVKKIEIDHRDPRLVLVLLAVKSGTPVTQGTRATLNSKGLTGITYVALEDDGTNLRPIAKLPGEEYPIISTSPSFFWRLDTGLKRINESISKVTTAIQALLDQENLHSIKEILIDVRHITRTLTSDTEQIDTIIHNTAKASKEFLPVVQSSKLMMQNITTQLLPAAHQAMLNLDVITNNLTSVSQEIKNNPAVLIRGKNPQPLGPGEK